MKNMRKVLSLIGILLIIIVSSTFFSCKKSENNIFFDFPIEYKLKIDATAQKNIKINENIEFNSEVDCDKILLSCYALAYSEKVVEDDMFENAYPNGFDKGEVKFNSLKVNGEEKGFTVDTQNQTISIDYKTKVGEKICLDINYELTLANVKHRLGYFGGFYSLSEFYPHITPVIDGKYSPRPYSKIGEVEFLKIANFEVELTVQKGNVIVHTGEMIDNVQGEKSNVYNFKAQNVRDFSLFWSKNLTMMSRESNGVRIKYYYNNDTTPTQELELIENALKTFGESFGEYGHSNLSVVLAPFAYAGMEYSEIALVSNDLGEKARQEVIIHEIAHQWWYMKVGTDQAYSPWLDESLAEFSTALFYLRNNDGKTFEKFRQYGLSVLESRIISNKPYAIKGAIYDFDSMSYSDSVYTIGSLMWINYYSIKGPSLIEDLKNYAETFSNKTATEKDIIEYVFKGYESMLSGWLEGKVII